MAKFFVGQRVRLVRARLKANNGIEGRIEALGLWTLGQLLPTGRILSGNVPSVDAVVQWDKAVSTANNRIEFVTPVNTYRLEPIQPEGHCAGQPGVCIELDNLILAAERAES